MPRLPATAVRETCTCSSRAGAHPLGDPGCIYAMQSGPETFFCVEEENVRHVVLHGAVFGATTVCGLQIVDALVNPTLQALGHSDPPALVVEGVYFHHAITTCLECRARIVDGVVDRSLVAREGILWWLSDERYVCHFLRGLGPGARTFCNLGQEESAPVPNVSSERMSDCEACLLEAAAYTLNRSQRRGIQYGPIVDPNSRPSVLATYTFD